MEAIINLLGLFFLALVIMLGVYIYNSLKRKRKIQKKINVTWGREPLEKYNTDDMVSIASYYQNKKDKDSSPFLIDDITWNDLDMEKVFKRINCTHTSVGEEYLYNMLRTLDCEENKLIEKSRVIKYFNDNPEERKQIQYWLEHLGKERYANVSSYMGDFLQMSMGKVILYKGLALFSVFSILLTIYNLNNFWMIFISFFVNMFVFYNAKSNLEYELRSIGYVARLMITAKKLTKLDNKGIEAINKKLAECNKKLSKLGKASYGFSKEGGGDPISEYVRIAFLTDLNNYNKTLRLLKSNQEYFREIYELIGFLDSMISVASYRKSLVYYSEPDLKHKLKSSNCLLKVIDIYHPLIKEPIVNSIELKKSLLLTGSNASGKSTFLKSLALNAIFAQTIFTCLAKEYKSNYFFVLSSMALRDDLSSKESYFIAEIKSLKRIFDKLNDEVPCLCFIDEILRGTNTIERIASSSRVLKYLSEANCLSVAATHDVELTKILETKYVNYHFQEKITEDEIVFDYKLYDGKSKTRNAIKLLKLMGFEKMIVEDADKAALEFEDEGTWGAL